MPYVRKGTTVYKKQQSGGHTHLVKVGTSKTVAKAKAYVRALYVHTKGK